MHNGQKIQAWEREQDKLLDLTWEKLNIYNDQHVENPPNIFDKNTHVQLQRALQSIRDQLAVSKSIQDTIDRLATDKNAINEQQEQHRKHVIKLVEDGTKAYRSARRKLNNAKNKAKKTSTTKAG